MPRTRPADDGLVTVYPCRVTTIPGIAHREQRVTPEQAAVMTAWMSGGAFTTDPDDERRLWPPGPPIPIHPPGEEAVQPIAGPVDETGPSDSEV